MHASDRVESGWVTVRLVLFISDRVGLGHGQAGSIYFGSGCVRVSLVLCWFPVLV